MRLLAFSNLNGATFRIRSVTSNLRPSFREPVPQGTELTRGSEFVGPAAKFIAWAKSARSSLSEQFVIDFGCFTSVRAREASL
jgi:hypothetical protein